jgi:rSAM/selenodomain-associated transferase 1
MIALSNLRQSRGLPPAGQGECVQSVAIGIFCKTPIAGRTKTRLSPPLRPDDCAALSECFIRDLAATIDRVRTDGGVTGFAIYTPVGSERELRALLPPDFRLLPQIDGGLGVRLLQAACDLLNAGHAGAILVNGDSPTLPASILRAATEAVCREDAVVLGPAIDGGYTLIGLSKPHARLFEDIPWSTADVYRMTVERAGEIGLPVVNVPLWYDIDDAKTLHLLIDEMAGLRPTFAEPGLSGADAPATRKFLRRLAIPTYAEPQV